MPQLLPPLDHRRTRLLLLASTYYDAVQASEDGGTGGKPSSKLLSRDEYLWPRGSYKDLERALDKLRPVYRPWLACFEHVYMRHGAKLIRGKRGTVIGYVGPPRVTHHPPLIQDGKLKRKAYSESKHTIHALDLGVASKADAFLTELEKRLKDSPLFVPLAISLAAGYLESEAKAYEPAWSRRAA